MDTDRVQGITSVQHLSSIAHTHQMHQYMNMNVETLFQQQLQLQLELQRQQPQQQTQFHRYAALTNGRSNHGYQHPPQQHQHQFQNQLQLRHQIQNQHHSPEKELIDLVTCKLCKGYLIDAATLDVCMHSFCRPCAVKYIRDKPSCPECHEPIKDKRVLNRLKADVTKQNIVYKLVPGLYEREMARRRKFYAERPTTRYKSEMFGDIPPSKTIKPDDMLNVCLTWMKNSIEDACIKTYLHCRADSSMLVLKKLIVGKFGLELPVKIYYGGSEIFFDLTTLMDVAAAYNWAPENKILSLSFKEGKNGSSNEDKKSSTNSLPLTNSDHDP